MLVLSRKKDQAVVIGRDVRVLVVELRGDSVKLGLEAPRDSKILREELIDDDAWGVAADEHQANGRHWAAVRRRDGARCFIWVYQDAGGATRCSCSRGHASSLNDFDLIAPAVWPVGGEGRIDDGSQRSAG